MVFSQSTGNVTKTHVNLLDLVHAVTFAVTFTVTVVVLSCLEGSVAPWPSLNSGSYLLPTFFNDPEPWGEGSVDVPFVSGSPLMLILFTWTNCEFLHVLIALGGTPHDGLDPPIPIIKPTYRRTHRLMRQRRCLNWRVLFPSVSTLYQVDKIWPSQ